MIKKLSFIIAFLFIALAVTVNGANVGDRVSVGGMPFGVRFYTEGVLVYGVSEVDSEGKNSSPGERAGIKKGDLIIKINNKAVESSLDVVNAASESQGKPLSLDMMRGNESYKTEIVPIKSASEDKFMLGLWIKDGTEGIGTVTYFEDNGEFVGLGHGVCDNESSTLLQMKKGEVCDVIINDVKPGEKGFPGQIQGFFSDNRTGALTDNTEQGVYGIYNKLPLSELEAVVASKEEVKEGEAYILCTLDDNIISKFDINIEKINHNDEKTKNFVIKITDSSLLAKTGGIVQGMSGSPIIQDGKLVGAVTHVLVDDPARGYGIFIDNMLDTA